MNRPADISAKISAYLDGELTEEESAGLKEILMKDGRWHKRLEELRRLNSLLSLWDQLEVQGIQASVDYEQRLTERLRNLCHSRHQSGPAPGVPTPR